MHTCSQCGNEVPNHADNCLYCGQPMLNVQQVSTVGNRSRLEPAKTDMLQGALFSIAGLAGGVFSLTLSLLFGLFLMIGSIGLFIFGTHKMLGTSRVKCPHCGNQLEISVKTIHVRCKACGKRSVRVGEYLEAVSI